MTVSKIGYCRLGKYTAQVIGEFIPLSDKVKDVLTCRYRCKEAQIISIYTIGENGQIKEFFENADSYYYVLKTYNLTCITTNQKIIHDCYRYHNIGNYTGSIKLYWDNGNVHKFLNYKDGKLDGLWQKYDTDAGSLVEEGYFKDGEKNGHWITWDNGKRLEDRYYKSGKKDGHWKTWNSDGKLVEQTYYENGVAVEPIIGYQASRFCKYLLTFEIFPGSYKSRAKSDNIVDKKTALYDFVKNTTIKSIWNIRSEKEVEEFKSNGKIYKIGDFYPGCWFYLDRQVAIDYWRSYNIGNYTGTKTSYYNNGNKEFVKNYKDGKLDGLWQKFSQDGKLIAEKYYKDDVEVKPHNAHILKVGIEVDPITGYKTYTLKDGVEVKPPKSDSDNDNSNTDNSIDNSADNTNTDIKIRNTDNSDTSEDSDIDKDSNTVNVDNNAKVVDTGKSLSLDQLLEQVQKEHDELLTKIKKAEEIRDMQIKNDKNRDKFESLMGEIGAK